LRADNVTLAKTRTARFVARSNWASAMWRFLVIMILTLVASCADTPGREASANSESECPAWKVEVVDDGRIYCVDSDIWERRDEDW